MPWASGDPWNVYSRMFTLTIQTRFMILWWCIHYFTESWNSATLEDKYSSWVNVYNNVLCVQEYLVCIQDGSIASGCVCLDTTLVDLPLTHDGLLLSCVLITLLVLVKNKQRSTSSYPGRTGGRTHAQWKPQHWRKGLIDGAESDTIQTTTSSLLKVKHQLLANRQTLKIAVYVVVVFNLVEGVLMGLLNGLDQSTVSWPYSPSYTSEDANSPPSSGELLVGTLHQGSPVFTEHMS